MIPMKDGLYNIQYINEENKKVHTLDSMPDGQYRVISDIVLDKQDNTNSLKMGKKDDKNL